MNLTDFINGIEYRNPIQVNRYTQGADIYLNNEEIGHERTHFPCNIFKEITTSFWTNDSHPEEQGKQIAKKFGGEYQEHFYGPEKFGFIIFSQEGPGNKYLELVFNYLKETGKIH